MTTNSIHIQGHRILFEMYEVILFTIGTLVINIIYFVLLDRQKLPIIKLNAIAVSAAIKASNNTV